MFFYAGHGLQVAGQNYLVPIDAELKTASALDFEMVRVEVVQRVMESETSTNVLFLDACRDNPLARNLARAMGTRSSEIGRGFAPIVSGVGTLISFSTQPGNVALDGAGRNSPFAAALVKQLVDPRDDLSAILIDVRNDVMKETQNKQVPWEHSALRGRFYFAASAKTALPPSPAVPATPSYSAAADAARVCREVEGMSSLSMLGVLAKQHKGTPAGDCIAARVDELKKQQVAVAAPPPIAKAPPTPEVKPAVQVTPVPTLVPSTVFRDCPDCPEMVVVPAGSFTMGSPESEPQRESWQKGTESPQLKVTIAQPFGVGQFAVTRGEFAEFVTATGHRTEGGCYAYTGTEWKLQAGRNWRSPGFSQNDRHPVVCVNWDDAKAYTSWLSRKTGKSYRLLSEAEREYVTRAGTTTPFWWGSSISPTQANYDGSAAPYQGGGSKGVWRKATVPVDSFAANPWGLYNVHGNVWEWTEDCWKDSHTGNPGNGSISTTGDCGRRVLRGGSWFYFPQILRSALRGTNSTDFRLDSIGFRLARTLSP